MTINELLPIGSVVLLKEGEKRLMITGIKQMDMDGDDTEYDYLGVLYPEGYMGNRFQYLFNHGDIDKILFRGYEDEERQAFLNKLSSLYGTK